jgi:hypothetical protein
MRNRPPHANLPLFIMGLAALFLWLAPYLPARAQMHGALSDSATTSSATEEVGGRDAGQPARPVAYHVVVPLTGVSHATVQFAAMAGTTVPMWNFQVTSPVNGQSYSGTMVGRSPFFHGARTTNIPTVVVPLIVDMPDGGVFDPTAADPCAQSNAPLALTQGSPILQTASFNMNGADVGTTQYIDAFQRANFWAANVSTTGDRYHTMLSPVTTTSAQTFKVPSGEGATYPPGTYGSCGEIGVVDFSAMDNFVQNTLIPSLAGQGVGPAALPIIILGNVVLGYPGDTFSNCCIIGYHGAFGSTVQTYALADYDTTGIFLNTGDVSALSHEIGEWQDDPLGTNPTPAWGHVGQVNGCQSNLEVGDPLSGTLFTPVAMPDGITYHPQELAFFSWFYRQSPSIGTGGLYSDNGTFTGSAGAVCH